MPERQEGDIDGFGEPPGWFNSRVHEIWHYWNIKRGDRRAPDRADLDPVLEIPSLVSGVWLLDVVDGGNRLRYRLIGDDLHAAGVVARTGEYLDEQPTARNSARTLAGLRKSVETATPYWRCGQPTLLHDQYIAGLEFIGLPLTVGNGRINMLLNYTYFTRQGA